MLGVHLTEGVKSVVSWLYLFYQTDWGLFRFQMHYIPTAVNDGRYDAIYDDRLWRVDGLEWINDGHRIDEIGIKFLNG